MKKELKPLPNCDLTIKVDEELFVQRNYMNQLEINYKVHS